MIKGQGLVPSFGVFLLALVTALMPTSTAAAAPSTSAESSGPIKVAGQYLDAMGTSDLDAAGKLFSSTSSVFESGGREGDWATYREHHLGPENDQIKAFKITRDVPEVASSRDRSMALVAWPIEYRIELKDGKVIESKGAVTFLVVKEKGEYRIRHLHWSSRRKPSPTK